MSPRKKQLVFALAMAALAAVTVVAIRRSPTPRMYAYVHRPVQIMGTETELTAVARSSRGRMAAAVLHSAEKALRDVEARMSQYISASELSRLNASEAGRTVKLSAPTLGLLGISHRIALQTDGAFDVTCRPILQVWRKAVKKGHPPTDAEIALAVGLCGWDKIELLSDGARKRLGGGGVDLGGIAKGFGIDRAVEAMQKTGVTGGLVNVGGDVRCFGRRPDGGKWRIAVRSPFDPKTNFAVLELAEGSVCTSGNYQRFFRIGEERFNHIVDPRTGRPVDQAPSVTVVAPTATIADAWATALSVLGDAGLKTIPPESRIEAMLIIGTPKKHHVRTTPGFNKLFSQPPNPVPPSNVTAKTPKVGGVPVKAVTFTHQAARNPGTSPTHPCTPSRR
ncbi:MAG: FAD:protein FMN transferase [Phycisphaerae bacterium]|jgi:thiamine biosynthesis lipoprotein|nr:FAD:protein FMN transferase [Phycisphaerae bacterium]MDP7636592.1 FAD:protein FMN transferase [Phycisphaerae bacterium]